jgi:hypothetical protein
MVKKTDALKIFESNIERTNQLINSVDKIHAYNRIYQENTIDNYLRDAIKKSQIKELDTIRTSCYEHAIISLATAYESYYKELLQQLISELPNYFLDISTIYSLKINELINSEEHIDYNDIENIEELNLRNRFGYYKFFIIRLFYKMVLG